MPEWVTIGAAWIQKGADLHRIRPQSYLTLKYSETHMHAHKHSPETLFSTRSWYNFFILNVSCCSFGSQAKSYSMCVSFCLGNGLTTLFYWLIQSHSEEWAFQVNDRKLMSSKSGVLCRSRSDHRWPMFWKDFSFYHKHHHSSQTVTL